MDTFKELAKDFYYSTQPDGYEAYYALREVLAPESEKRSIIDALIAEEEEAERQLQFSEKANSEEKGRSF